MNAAAACVAAAFIGAAAPSTSDGPSLLDLLELDMGYTTIADHYYRDVAPSQFLAGARLGMIAYLRSRGIRDPNIAQMRARPDGRGVVPAIGRELGKAMQRYGHRLDALDFVYATIRGELGGLHDPYSVFFSKAEVKAFTTALDGATFGGIGVVLGSDAAGFFHADQIFDGSPAQRAGIGTGDEFVAVDGTPLAGLPSASVAALLRGRTGTMIRLDVKSTGDATPRRLTLVRAPIAPPDVTARRLPDDIGYLALRTFGPTAGEQVHAALVRLRTAGTRATIFDLRGNGGGYESSAVRVASAFVPRGAIVLTQTNHGHRLVTSADGTAPRSAPLAVLVDGDSASGSELVAGAIADHRLGTIVGKRTFGKGLVQTIFPLPDGSAIKLTTARYFTPSGRNIDRVGITPDIVVDEPSAAVRGTPGRDPQLDAAIALFARPPAATAPSAAPTTYR